MNTMGFRKCLGEFATGISIVATKDNDGRVAAMTISSFNSVSLDPPLVLFCIARSSGSFDAFYGCSSFAVSVLHHGQAGLSSRFGKPMADNSKALDWLNGENGMPVVPDALAKFECDVESINSGGDHAIVVGRVTRFERYGDRAPLLFFRGGYHEIVGLDAAQR